MKIYIIIIILTVFFSTASATPVGTAFLRIGIDARSGGLGEAFCGLADDVGGIYYNPAGLGFAHGTELCLTHIHWIEDIKIENIGILYPITRYNTIGINITYLHTQDILELDKAGNVTGKFNVYNFSTILTYTRRVSKKFSFGLNLKYISETNDIYQTSTNTIDAGIMWKPYKCISFGLSIQNIMSNYQRILTYKYILPKIIRAGMGIKLKNMIFTIDNISFDGGAEYFMVAGIEYHLGNVLIFRIGYEKNPATLFSITGGIGWRINEYQLDYAFVPHGELGYTHRISLCIRAKSHN